MKNTGSKRVSEYLNEPIPMSEIANDWTVWAFIIIISLGGIGYLIWMALFGKTI